MTTAKEVAMWMQGEIETIWSLDQADAARRIERHFGENFTCTNRNGHHAISKPVVLEFEKLTGDTVVWSRKKQRWRKRREWDGPGR